ncbi:Golgi transport complex subunit 5-domain-containing protein [Ephemerocybe angulata]|uniref:Conserved oligomeric Golgi complex subunit 5 n=1 Tax=Ephemerocybe angulata TaxID=980116 RepID=A0A8H6I7K2_9AGAR|nr:Golgi transport complex subunit 5-domain-containing protein [Tulosesus angulatus]
MRKAPIDLSSKSMDPYSVFANPDFDPNDYANAILAGEPYPPPTSDSKTGHAKSLGTMKSTGQDSIGKEDISVALSKLTFGIDDVSKQIKSLVTAHHEHLLGQAASASSLSGSLVSVRSGLNELNNSLEKLQQRVHVPYEALQELVVRLRKLQEAADILRRTSRFVILARRLQLQMSEMKSGTDNLPSTGASQNLDVEDDRERAIAKAALTISEIFRTPLAPPLLRSISAVAAFEPFVEESKTQVNTEMEQMVMTGLKTLNQTVLASSLQTAFNLGVLPELVSNLLHDLSQAVEDRIKSAFDLSKISKEALSKEPGSNSSQSYRSRVRTEPTNVTAPQWAAALWGRLEAMFDEMAECCIKVYALEKVLKIKKNPNTLSSFLDEVVKALDNKPGAMFWMSLGVALDKRLLRGYPKLLRLFHQFFSRIAVHTDTVYTDTHQSPETILVLRSLAQLEMQYLSRSANKLNETITQAFSGGSRSPPSTTEASTLCRIAANEIDSAKFDPLLVKSVAKNVATCLDSVVNKAGNMMIRDRSALSLLGPIATPQHLLNASLATFLYQSSLRLSQLEGEHNAGVYKLIKPAIENIQDMYATLVSPMQQAIQREISAILAKLHRIDFGQQNSMPSGSSLCLRELSEKLSFIKDEVLGTYDIGEAGRAWIVSIVKFTIRNFLLHISIAKPLSESGKLQMTSDMTELEFALNSFMAQNNQSRRGDNLQALGEEYRALRAMRPLLFLENQDLSSPEATSHLPPIIVLHHILVRSTIPLPHKLHGWQEAEYVRWLDEHTDQESWTLIDGGLSHWERIAEAEGTDTQEANVYAALARTVLKNCRERGQAIGEV